MKRNIKLYIKDMIEYIERAEKYLNNLSYEEFINDLKTCDAIIRCIEVIGEAAKKVPENLKNKYPFIPWRDIAGMRDKIVHGYFSIDYEVVWLTIKEDIPKLKPLLKNLLEELEKSNHDFLI